MAPDRHFGIVCFALPDERVRELPLLLRRVFATEPFRTRRKRLGKVARVSAVRMQYYTTESWGVRTMDWAAG